MMSRATTLFFAIFLAACGGGGGGGGLPTPPSPPEPVVVNLGGASVIYPVADFQTPEFTPECCEEDTDKTTSSALEQIKAQHAYARGGTGAGVTVAVIDSGFDINHPDLAGKFTDDSINIVTSLTVESALYQGSAGHGTAVAGVIAAKKNDKGSHGIAFDAEILAIRNNNFDCDDPNLLFFDPVVCRESGEDPSETLADSIDYAVEKEALIINITRVVSLTPRLETAISNAIDSGAILIMASGNFGDPSPTTPASFADFHEARGQVLAVGGVDRDDQTIYNRCADASGDGTVVAYCMVAPAASIIFPEAGQDDIEHTERRDGTSFSAPLVSGAAALLMQMFPVLRANPRHLIQLLLDTATDLGEEGDDVIFGAGLLNLEEAVKPQGISVLPLANGATARLDESRFVAGAAFGAGLTAAAAGAVFVDGYGRAYPLDLRRLIAPMKRDFGLHSALSVGDGERRRGFALPVANLSLRLGAAGVAADKMAGAALDPQPADVRLDFGLRVAERAVLRLGANAPPPIALPPLCRECGFLSAAETLSPIFALAPTGGGFALGGDFGNATEVAFGGAGGDDGWIAAARVIRRATDGGFAAATVGALSEGEKILGGHGEGAFQSAGALTRFVELSAQTPLTDSLAAFAAATFAAADARDAGLLSDWRRIYADAYAAGIKADAGGGQIAALIAQPLRVKNAAVRLTAPVGRDESGGMQTRAIRINAAPGGREIQFQLSYSRPLRRDLTIQTWAAARVEPGHDQAAASDFAVGARADWEF